MRLIGRDGIARAIYVTASGMRVVAVRAFVKKTQRMPRRELELARRMGTTQAAIARLESRVHEAFDPNAGAPHQGDRYAAAYFVRVAGVG
jgi:hypothetical protein